MGISGESSATIDDSLNENWVLGAKYCGSSEPLKNMIMIIITQVMLDFPSSTRIHNFMLALNSTIALNKNMPPQDTSCLQTKSTMNVNTICLAVYGYLFDISSTYPGELTIS